jgi:uncharacterized protein YjiS (DUF1127 family)
MSTRSATIVSLSSSCPSRAIQPSATRARQSLVLLAPAMLMHVVRLATAWRHFNSELDRLNRMSDRELAERGISRSDVIHFAMEHSER